MTDVHLEIDLGFPLLEESIGRFRRFERKILNVNSLQDKLGFRCLCLILFTHCMLP